MTKTTSLLDNIVERGNQGPDYMRTLQNDITCVDGFALSVIAGRGTYCTPRPDWPFEGGTSADYSGPYTHVEVGFPSERPEPWEPVDGPECWQRYAEDPEEPTETVYGYVPVALVRHLIELHGGER